MSSERLHVLQLIDTLEAGGAESVSVALSNELSTRGHRVTLGTTRRDGPLVARITVGVERLRLERRHRLDWGAVRRLARYIQEQDVDLIHAHSTSVLIAAAARGSGAPPPIIWHIHSGRLESMPRLPIPYRLIRGRIAGVIAVSRALESWSRRIFDLTDSKLCYIPNFIDAPRESQLAEPIPGKKGHRIVCVANFRPEKDHATLLAAFESLPETLHDWSLLLIGEAADLRYYDSIQRHIDERKLGDRVHLLGKRMDVPAVLERCDVGVLSSRSEGLPLALLEYGRARLAVVATDVGEVREVLEDGRGGSIVAPGSPKELEAGLRGLLSSAAQRARLGHHLAERVGTRYSAPGVMDQLLDLYNRVSTDASR